MNTVNFKHTYLYLLKIVYLFLQNNNISNCNSKSKTLKLKIDKYDSHKSNLLHGKEIVHIIGKNIPKIYSYTTKIEVYILL